MRTGALKPTRRREKRRNKPLIKPNQTKKNLLKHDQRNYKAHQNTKKGYKFHPKEQGGAQLNEFDNHFFLKTAKNDIAV